MKKEEASVSAVDAPGKDVFAGLVNSTFRLHTAEGDLAMRLVEFEEGRASTEYEQFSLIFSADEGAPPEQGVYHVEHNEVGSFDLFLVPIAANGGGIDYQAVFNRIIDEPADPAGGSS
jgi:hypothetical protein